MSEDKVCQCISWIIDSAYSLGRAAELAASGRWIAADDQARLADYLLRKEVEKCFPTGKIRAKIEDALKHIKEMKAHQAWFTLSDAKTTLERKAQEICRVGK